MSRWPKIRWLAPLLLKRPEEFIDRLEAILDVQTDHRCVATRTNYQFLQYDEAIQSFENALDWDLHSYLNESYLIGIERTIQENTALLTGKSPFLLTMNADPSLAEFCYAVCRSLKPEVIIETGTAHGVTTSFILKALCVNQKGTLHSIDLPPLGNDADMFVGILVPEELRRRWRLHRGSSKRVLPKILSQLDKVEVFVHDSLHTYRNVMRELEMVFPLLAKPSVVLVDDVHLNSAFSDWVEKTVPSFWAIVREQDKNSAFGLAIFQ